MKNDPKPRFFSFENPTVKILALTTGLFASIMSTTILSVLSPKIIDYFDITYLDWQNRNILFFSLFATSLVLMGKLSDLFNAKKQLTTGLFLFALTCLGSIGSAALKDWHLFLFFQGLQAICDAALAPAVVLLIRSNFEKERLGWAFGCFSSATAGGGIVGAALGGAFSGKITWYYSIFILLAFAVVSLLLLKKSIASQNSSNSSLNSRKIAFNCISTLVLASVVWLTQFVSYSNPLSLRNLTLVILLASFVFIEHHQTKRGNALIPWRLFKILHFSSASIRVFLSGIIVNVNLLVFPIAFQSLFLLPATHISAMIMLKGILISVLGAYTGKLVDKNLIFSLIGGVAILLCALFAISGYLTPVTLGTAISYYILFAISASLNSPAQFKLLAISIDKTEFGQGMGFYHFMQFVAGAFAAGIIGKTFVNQSSQISINSWKNAILICLALTAFRILILGFDIRKLINDRKKAKSAAHQMAM